MTNISKCSLGWTSLVLLLITAQVDGLLQVNTRLSLVPRCHVSHQIRRPNGSPSSTPHIRHSPALTSLYDTAGDDDQPSTISSTGSVKKEEETIKPSISTETNNGSATADVNNGSATADVSNGSTPTNVTTGDTTTTTTTTTPEVKSIVIEGIGGKGGLVYDVNRLKRNLMQETMASYKEELWDLLGSSVPANDQEVVEKLVALVQASPVRTTTDSNLLDGQDDWVLAYRSQYPTTVASLVLYDDADTMYAVRNKDKGSSSNNGAAPYNARYNFLWNSNNHNDDSNNSDANKNDVAKKKSRTKKNKFLQRSVFWNKLKEFFQTKQRTFRLEELADDEDSYVKDTTYVLGGLLTRTQQYALDGLTRSSLILHPLSTRWSLMGQWPSPYRNATKSTGSSNKEQRYVSFQFHIVYLDNDLCILTEQDGSDCPFMVYTRNKAYLNSTMKRKTKLLRAAFGSLFQRRQDDNVSASYSSSSLNRRKGRYGTAKAVDPILKEIIQNEARKRRNGTSNTNSSIPTIATKLRVLRLGDVNDDQEDESWESESDPFVHLSADERQLILKGMSVEEIEQVADAYRNKQSRFRWLRKLLGMGRRKKQTFKKPPEKWQRPRKR